MLAARSYRPWVRTACTKGWDRCVAELALTARQARDRPSFVLRALELLSGVLPFESAVFSRSEPETSPTLFGIEPGALPLIERCERHFADYVPEVQPVFDAAARDGGVIDRNVFGSNFIRAPRFYAEIMRPQRLTSSLILMPRWGNRGLGILRMERHSGPHFRDTHLSQALALMPLFELAMTALAFTPPGAECLAPLTSRESEIAQHVTRGLTTPQIATLLGTSKFTIRNQISRIFDKTHVASRSELAAWIARRQGAT